MNHRGEDGWTALLEACEKGSTEIVQLLINAGADVNVSYSFHKLTPLTIAADKNSERIMKILLDAGAQPNLNAGEYSAFPAHRLVTPLMWAAYRGSSRLARLLLRRGAKLRTTNYRGERARDIAKLEGHRHCHLLLCEAEKHWTKERASLYSRQFNDVILILLLVELRQARNSLDRKLPRECWTMIIEYLNRDQLID